VALRDCDGPLRLRKQSYEGNLKALSCTVQDRVHVNWQDLRVLKIEDDLILLIRFSRGVSAKEFKVHHAVG
jgi:hypothetical protein